jgi:hypothetical protein
VAEYFDEGSVPHNIGFVVMSHFIVTVQVARGTCPMWTLREAPGKTQQRIRDRHRDSLALRPGGRRPARHHRGRPERRDGTDPAAGLRDPRRHPDPDRPGRRPEALQLTANTTVTASTCRSSPTRQTPRLGLSSPAGLEPRPDRGPHPQHHRRPEQRRRHDLRR